MTPREIFYRFPKEMPLPFVLDGATGTALMRAGMPKGVCTAKYVLDNPDVFRRLQLSYGKAGSDAVLTPTFDGNRPTLRRHGIQDDVCAFNRSLAALSEGSARYSGADMSTTGLFLEPYGDASFDEVASIYAEQAAAVANEADFFFIETMISLAEVRAAVTGVKSVSDKPVMTSLTVDKNGRTLSGDALIPAFLTLSDLGVSAFGCNCSVGPEEMLEALRPVVPFAAAFGIPLIAKPNAGIPHEENGVEVFSAGAADYSAAAREFIDSGIMVLGGCCGSDELCIAAIRAQADKPSGFDPSPLPSVDKDSLCCTNRLFGVFDASVSPIDVTEDIADDFMDCEDDVPLLLVADMDAAGYLLEAAFSFDRPFALTGDDAAVSAVRRKYNGRAVVVK